MKFSVITNYFLNLPTHKNLKNYKYNSFTQSTNLFISLMDFFKKYLRWHMRIFITVNKLILELHKTRDTLPTFGNNFQ